MTRKEDSKCIVDQKLSPKLVEESCECTKIDFECDVDFIRQNEDCKLISKPNCIPGSTYLASSGYRKRTSFCSGGVNLESKTEKTCPSENDTIQVTMNTFQSPITKQIVLRKAKESDFSLLVVRSNDGKVFVSKKGKVFDLVFESSIDILTDDYNFAKCVAVSQGKKHVIIDSDGTFSEFETPSETTEVSLTKIEFHPTKTSTFIFYGQECPFLCKTVAYITENNGKTFDRLMESQNCIWSTVAKGPFCISKGILVHNDKEIMNNVVDIKNIYSFIVVAQVTSDPESPLSLYTSSNGKEFIPAIFNKSPKQNGYSFIDEEHRLVMDVYENRHVRAEIGSLFVSNFSGHLFTQSLANTNRDSRGRVDIQRVNGIEGTLLANSVLNAFDVEHSDAKKDIETLISFDDAGSWKKLVTSCPTCYLTVHDMNDNFASSGGILMVSGSQGDGNRSLFVSKDGGTSFFQSLSGNHFYNILNYGNILVSVDKETNVFKYSTDHGSNWTERKIADSSLEFTRFLAVQMSHQQLFFILQAGSTVVQVEFNLKECTESDLEEWKISDECILGQKTIYTRKKKEAECFTKKLEEKNQACECTMQDYEW